MWNSVCQPQSFWYFSICNDSIYECLFTISFGICTHQSVCLCVFVCPAFWMSDVLADSLMSFPSNIVHTFIYLSLFTMIYSCISICSVHQYTANFSLYLIHRLHFHFLLICLCILLFNHPVFLHLPTHSSMFYLYISPYLILPPSYQSTGIYQHIFPPMYYYPCLSVCLCIFLIYFLLTELSIYPSIYIYIYLYTYSFIHVSINLFIHPSVHLYINLFISKSIYLTIYPSSHLSVNLPVQPDTYSLINSSDQ